MKGMKEERYTNLILEEMRGQTQTILEIVLSMQPQVAKIPAMEENIAELKADMKIVKQAVAETNKDLKLLERRVTNLEKSAA